MTLKDDGPRAGETMTSTKGNATGQGGVGVAGGQAKAIGQHKVLECSADHITRIVRELHDHGVGLCNSSVDTQLSTLPKALAYLSDRGLNTYEGTAASYARLATRIQNLEADGWINDSRRENVIVSNDLSHRGIARYVLIGRLPEPLKSNSAEGMQ